MYCERLRGGAIFASANGCSFGIGGRCFTGIRYALLNNIALQVRFQPDFSECRFVLLQILLQHV